MICPACRSDMIIVEHENIELDYCTNCRGVWFDAGELELLLESAGLGNSSPFFQELLTAPDATSSENRRKCPICRKRMKKVFPDKKQEILLDVCQDEDGIWFDGGELVHLTKSMCETDDSRGRVLCFLEEVFKLKK